MFETNNNSPPGKHEVPPSSQDKVTLDHEINYTLADVTGREMHWSTSYFRNLDKASKRPVRSVPWPPTSFIMSRPTSPPSPPVCDHHKPLPSPPLSRREVTAVGVEKVEQVSLLPTPSVESPGGNSSSPRLEQVSSASGEEKEVDDATAAQWVEGFQREQDRWEGSSPTKADLDAGPPQRASLTNTTCEESVENVRGDQRSISMSECSYEENPITIPADAGVNTRESIGSKNMEIDDERTSSCSWSRNSISEISAEYAVERSIFRPGDETIVSKSVVSSMDSLQ
jgi:hypothetical protein